MTPDDLQRTIIEAALALPNAGALALAGGWAMREHRLTQRPTHDVDLFTPVRADVVRVAGSLNDALRALGLEVTRVRSVEGFSALEVKAPGGDPSVLVEIGQDARMWPAIVSDLGPVIAVQELAADKMLAMFGRAAARDLIDLQALNGVFSIGEMADLARLKDPGFSNARFNEALWVAAARPDADFEGLGLTPEQVVEVRAAAAGFVLASKAEE